VGEPRLLLTVDEAAKRLRVHRATVYRLIARKQLRLTKVGGSSFITDREIERYLRAAERTTAA
jgi:excisionase family DNA binding protein